MVIHSLYNLLKQIIMKHGAAENIKIKKIPIEKVMELLKEDGIEVSYEKAEQIMDFLYDLTRLLIKEYVL